MSAFTAIDHTFTSGATLSFLQYDDVLLGLNQAQLGDIPLKASHTVAMPYLASEWDSPRWVAPFLKLESVDHEDDKLTFKGRILGASDEALIRAFYMCENESGDPVIHQDLYRFPQLRVPQDFLGSEALADLYRRFAGRWEDMGSFTWTFTAQERNIAGWSWKGWSQQFSFELSEKQTNVLRQFATWELGGKVPGLTLVSVRYRGLGRIEQDITDDGLGRAGCSWATIEMLPELLGDTPAVSPVVPKSNAVMDRGYALQHRAGTWITYPARGGGMSFVDFQFRPEAALCSFTERQGNLRGATEVYENDPVVSQTDEEYFALSRNHTSEPRLFLALVPEAPLQKHEWRNRWLEVDIYVRDIVAEELGFVQRDVLPSVGELWDFWGQNGTSFVPFMKGAQEKAAKWREAGVKWFITHNSGNIDGRSVWRGWDGADAFEMVDNIKANCCPYDWLPLPATVEAWHEMYETLSKLGMEYFIWVTNMVAKEGPLGQRIGNVPGHWTLNSPDGKPNDTYGDNMGKPNVLDSHTRETLFDSWEQLKEQTGYDGMWLDSYQNLFMSQLDWANGTGNSTQRTWWEEMARMTREGLTFIAESHTFPGISCSIEVPNWEKDHWYLYQVSKWHRNSAWKLYTDAERVTLNYRMMAVKSWTAPEMLSEPEREPYDLDTVMPGFSRMAHEYLAALAYMQKPWMMAQPVDGMIWEGEGQFVCFPFADAEVPAGVEAVYILDESRQPVTRMDGERTYLLKGEDVLKAFNIQRGPLADER